MIPIKMTNNQTVYMTEDGCWFQYADDPTMRPVIPPDETNYAYNHGGELYRRAVEAIDKYKYQTNWGFDVNKMIINFNDIANEAGFTAGHDGKLNLPANQDTADKLEEAVVRMIGPWKPGDAPVEITLTGPGPVWGYLCIAHALHGRATRLIYAAPNATITIYSHGV